MPDYQNGKIYKLVGSGLTYYGSTTQALCKRKGGHKRKQSHNSGKCSSKILFEKGDVDIVLVENYPCNSKEELHSRERYYIENNECVNKRIPTRTVKEYREVNKDKIKEQTKEYYEKKKDKKKEYDILYRENNKEYYKEYHKEYQQNNKDRVNELQRLNRLKKKIDKMFYE